MEEKTFPDRYQNLAQIGEGGMGEVFQATDTLLQKIVAIKVLRKSVSPEATMRFQIEAKATARLNHPNIVKILDFGMTEEYSPYMVIEFLKGENLAVFLKKQKVVTVETFLQIFFQVCAALSHAHKQQILHRDLKPSNLIILVEDEKVSIKLVDFGIAKLFAEDQSITSTGAVLGSPLYMSPEQASGQKVDQRSDIYSLGCMMYECLAGRPPFRGATALETMSQHRTEEPPALRAPGADIPDWLETIVLKCLSKAEDERYQSVDELRTELTRGYESSGIESPEVDKVVKAFRPQSLFTRKTVALLVVLIGLIAARIAFSQGRVVELPKTKEMNPSEVSRSPKEEQDLDFISKKANMVVFKNKLRVNDMTDDQLVLCAEHPEPTDIDLLNCETLTGSGLKHLVARSPKSIKFRSEIQDKYFKSLGEMKDLRTLVFKELKQSDGSGFLELRDLKNLKSITLDDCRVSNVMLKNISQIDNVKIIRVTNSSGFDAEGLSYLKSHLIHLLQLSNSNLDDTILTGLRGMGVNDISITGNPLLTDKSCEVLKSLKYVNIVSFGDTGISTAGRLKLAASLGLKYQPTREVASKTNK